jgi:hypothetical protein
MAYDVGPDDFEDIMRDLEPSENNVLEQSPLKYNPLNHAYPMIADMPIGVVEVMVRFSIIRGKSNLPIDMLSNARELQVPMSIEDVEVMEEPMQFVGDKMGELPGSVVHENALISEMTSDERYYLIPMIVRARIVRPEQRLLSEKETVALFPAYSLFELICGYADKVAADPKAPKALLDLLDHFTGKRGRVSMPDPDEEWNDEDDDDDVNLN